MHRRSICRLSFILGLSLVTTAAPIFSQTASAPAASQPRKSVDELLGDKTAQFDFEDATIDTILTFVGRQFGVEIENNYKIVDLTAATEKDPNPKPLITIKIATPISAHEALNILNSSILPLGYSIVESVRDGDDAAHTPHVVMTVVTTRKDYGKSHPVFYGMDPEKIPEGEDLRTQIITLQNLDLEKARDIVASVLAKKADITLNPARKTLILTDSATHIHAAAAILQLMEKQAKPNP